MRPPPVATTAPHGNRSTSRTDTGVGASDPVEFAALRNATVLQILPSLAEADARAAVRIAGALVDAGARAVVAARLGPLLRELRALGGRWVPLAETGFGPFALPFSRRRNRRILADLIAAEQVDLIHALTPASAVLAEPPRAAAGLLLTSMGRAANESRLPWRERAERRHAAAFSHRLIASSIFDAAAVIREQDLDPDRLVVVPRSVDTRRFDPAAAAGRVASLRNTWRVPPADRVILVPGRVAAWNGQHVALDAFRILLDRGLRDATLVIAGETDSEPAYVRALHRQIRALELDHVVRIAGHCADMPAAMAAAHVVAVTALEAPRHGRASAEAQAMGRPVVTSAAGALPEHLVAPPRIAADLRTGWVVRPGDPDDLAEALAAPLALDPTAYDALSARARQFTDYMFSPASTDLATLAVYAAMLETQVQDR
ncbi:MAG TPA: glycosyltransferase [Xanthobacteraceae bacterium]|nr:glycosyltransferase [Xanthobacteraceae bacterium]